ncbi:cobalt ECF transporter T component CbiQ [Clostridium intestinale]|uniref:Cobalt ECF transporter T component CbiQ n=1 Tax=Clostridium intestinale TaxID=36845 RepID=A0A7D7AC06_9CLOT|nr:cobalt ECF transporter T component CbiQ [Clostridium intestinale]QLY78824.1 cobalt ECF transporter T component CbiQ [Clostridium intestinale]
MGKNNILREKEHKKKIRHKHGENISIDFYAYTSKIKNWNSTFKMIFSVALIAVCILLDNPYVSISVIFGMAYLTIIKGGLSLRDYLSVLMIPIVFILISIFTISVDISRNPIGEYNLYLGFGYVFTSKEMLTKGLFLLLKILGAISALQMMSLSTPSSDIIYVLRKAHVPKLIIELMNMIYRYIFILMDVSSKMKNSAEARLGYCDIKTSYYTFGRIGSNMLIVSFKKANSYYDAMESRCYDGELIFLEEEKKLDKKLVFWALLFIIFLVGLWSLTK